MNTIMYITMKSIIHEYAFPGDICGFVHLYGQTSEFREKRCWSILDTDSSDLKLSTSFEMLEMLTINLSRLT